MKTQKNRFVRFLIALCTLCLAAGVGNSQNVQAASKATYTIKKIQEKKTYRDSCAIYHYELPQLRGNSAAISKINKSLKSYYSKTLPLKKELFNEFKEYKKNGTLNKRTRNLFVKTGCSETYNKNGYIRFVFRFSWHECGSEDSNQTTVIYRLKDGARVSQIPSSAEESKILKLIKGVWYTTDKSASHNKVIFSGKTVKYCSTYSCDIIWTGKIDDVIRTSYGYYIKIDLGYNCHIGYQLRLNNKNSLKYIGLGDSQSSVGYSKSESLIRKK